MCVALLVVMPCLQNARLLARNANLEAEKTELMELSNALQIEVEDCRSSQVTCWRMSVAL
jgi:hypothetical protein